MSIITIGIIVGVLIYALVLFVLSKRGAAKTQGKTSEFFVAGRSVSPIVLLATMCLTLWSAASFYGYPSASYRMGIGYFAYSTGMFFMGALAPCILYPMWLLGKKYDYLSPVHLLTHRYGSRTLSLLCAFVFLAGSVPYIATQFIGIANSARVTSNGQIGFYAVVVVMTIFTFGHIIGGGNNSVVTADALAGVIGLSIVFTLTVTMAKQILPDGSLAAGTQLLQQTRPEALVHSGVLEYGFQNLGVSLSACIGTVVWPQVLIRAFMGRDPRVFKLQAVGLPLIMVTVFSCILYEGVFLGNIAFPGLSPAESENLLPMLVLNYMPPLFSVLVVMGSLAFGLSTCDSIAVSSSAIIHIDVMESTSEKTDKKKLYISLALFMAAVLLCVIFRPVFLITYVYSFCSPGWTQVGPAVLGGMFWKRGTKEGAFVSTFCGMAAVCYVLFINNPIPTMNPILWGLTFSIPLYIIVSLITKPDEKRAHEVVDFLHDCLSVRNNTTYKVLWIITIVVYFWDIYGIIHIGDASSVVFGWMPLQWALHILTAFIMATVGYFFCQNRFGPMSGVPEINFTKPY
ncbi:sodium:solute symporter [Synergistales bacterium]|nr:sodium:solute symporter [Synergistales bacterium]